jgi:hypothetical protein
MVRQHLLSPAKPLLPQWIPAFAGMTYGESLPRAYAAGLNTSPSNEPGSRSIVDTLVRLAMSPTSPGRASSLLGKEAEM